MTNLSQTEKALTTGASAVRTARGDVKHKCNTLSDRVTDMMSGWGGQGASAFGNLMVAWQQKQDSILQALDQLALSMEQTEADNVATDESQSDLHLTLQNRLG
ncbi:WXG100 family type VII secretion target [Nocardioides piscis]|uniref:ESAT-6-like protein n=1 Tax=Nocardioides piscis TaxID=2714938 RepID=A0A6G7YD01_9ACTN|nr:WXG100 family type VII secretion target [Nocardioides piscis]QIK74673.1 hypothetical protein G7071_03785 [Nocardioides piscis]